MLGGIPMYKICKTEQSAARQRELEQFLLREMQTRHFDDISISDLCIGMGIPRKAFYRYFSGKQGAFCALVDHTMADMDTFALSLFQETVMPLTRKQKAEVFFEFWKNQKPLLDAVERCTMWEQMMDRAVEYTLLNISRQRQLQHILDQQEYLIRASIYGIFAILQLWYRKGFPISASEVAKTCMFAFTELWSVEGTEMSISGTGGGTGWKM